MSGVFKMVVIVVLTGVCGVCFGQARVGMVVGVDDLGIAEVGVYSGDERVSETNELGVFRLPDSLRLPIMLRLEKAEFQNKVVRMTENNEVFVLVPSLKLQDLEEVLLRATLIKDSSNTSATELIIPTEIISSEKLEEFSPIGLVSAINEIPGVYIQRGAINTNRITIRGVGSRTLYGTNKIRAYYNGIPITNGGGETAIDSYNAEDLQWLEVVKGPKATEYGTNLGGTLLLTSKQAVPGETLFKSSLTLGSFALIKNTVSAATATEKFSINLNYDHLQTDGFRENNNYNRKGFQLTSNYKFNLQNEVGLLVKYTDYVAQIPSSIGKTAFEEDPSQAAYTWKAAQGFEANKQTLIGFSFTHRFSENTSNTSSVYYTYLDHYEPRPFNILDEYTNGYGARTVFSGSLRLLNRMSDFSFGAEYYKDEYRWETIENLYEENNGNGSLEGELLSDNFELRNNLNAFASLVVPISEKLKAQIGFNLNTTNYTFNDNFNFGAASKSANRNFDPILAPNVNVLYTFSKNISGYINLSRGFNYPSIEETLTPDGIINPELGPEKGWNYEVGSELFLFKRKLYLQVTTYLLSIDDLLVADRIGDDEYIGRNAGKTEHKGIEVQTRYLQQIGSKLYMAPYLNAEFTDHTFINFVDGESDYSGNQLTGVPAVKLNGGINLSYNKFTLNTNFLHLGEMPMNDSNSLYSDKYTVFNLKTTYKQALSKRIKMQLNFGIDNITDKKYASSILINATSFGTSEPRYYYPGRPRNWYGGIGLRGEM
ncbi:TonB-dependent receptor [Aequorivita sp. F47161]|uniref:TonB-dependent receptor n=1 Tax=Aequorivita vitellina TaxID=2874475 RepID=A0A9X1QZ51_9FLAO|nr:TonB-dependent receptor [Aequorivita vitellina]MCG2420489.1 TonB-dependent receptor [Aequorivita vitellina]